MDEISDKEYLTAQQVQEILEFSNFAYNTWSQIKKVGIYDPDILNRNLRNLNNNPQVATYETVVKALSNAPINAEQLQSFTEYMEYFDSVFNIILNYKANLLSFDLAPVCINAHGSDYKSKQYKDDKKRINNFLHEFDYKHEFKKAVKNMMRSSSLYVWFRQTKKNTKGSSHKYTLQILPQECCQTTGVWQDGLLFDFDMSYLLEPFVDIELFPPVFKKYLNNVLSTTKDDDYCPSNALANRRGHSSYWTQTSPDDGAWVFKFDMSTFNDVPPMASFLKNTVLHGDIQRLQFDKDMIGAYGILTGEIMMKKDSKQPNDFSISPEILGQLLQLVQSGLERNIKVGALPVSNQKFSQFDDKNKEMYANAIRESSNQGISATRLVYSIDKVSEAELIGQITTDYEVLKNLYFQFNNFLNFFANKKTKKFRWRFYFDGCPYWFDREERREKIIELADRGLILNEGAFAQAYGIPPELFENMLDEGKNGDLVDKLGQLISIHTASNTTNDQGGRPRKKRVATDSRDYDKKKVGKRT